MPFSSQRFIDTRTGEIVVQVPISEIAHFEEYDGPLVAGDFDRADPWPDTDDQQTIIITVTAEDVELDYYDDDVAGTYLCQVDGSLDREAQREAALDRFHSTVPIKVLDDFVIETSLGRQF